MMSSISHKDIPEVVAAIRKNLIMEFESLKTIVTSVREAFEENMMLELIYTDSKSFF
jgi:hypothetical protein